MKQKFFFFYISQCVSQCNVGFQCTKAYWALFSCVNNSRKKISKIHAFQLAHFVELCSVTSCVRNKQNMFTLTEKIHLIASRSIQLNFYISLRINSLTTR